jgi:hypothetical protein
MSSSFFSSLGIPIEAAPGLAPLRIDPKPALINAQVGSSRLAIAIAALFEWR